MNKIISYLQIQTIMFLLWLVDFKLSTKTFFSNWWGFIITKKYDFYATINFFIITICCTTLLWLINQYYFGWCYDNLWHSYVKLALLGYVIPFWFFMFLLLTIVGCMPVRERKHEWSFKIKLPERLKKIFKVISYLFTGILICSFLFLICALFYFLYLIYTTPSC